MSSIDSELLAVNGNTIEFSDAGDSQGGLSQPRLREETGRLQRSLRNLKGLLIRDVNQCKDRKHTSNWNMSKIISLYDE